MFFKGNTINEIISLLKNDGVVVIPTDTIYGIVCNSQSKNAVKKLYKIKQRDTNKPCIILVNNYKQIESFGIKISKEQKDLMDKYWPGALSIILACNTKKYEYLHRGIGSIAFRMIGKKNRNLYKILEEVGPILAPSANPQGLEPATCENKAKKYFGDSVDGYLAGGTRKSLPSTLIDYTGGKFKVLRQGKVIIK